MRDQMEELIKMLHEVADIVERHGTPQEIETAGFAIDKACDIRDLMPQDLEVPDEVRALLDIERIDIKRQNALTGISGGFCDYAVTREAKNGWVIEYKFGVTNDGERSFTVCNYYLRKDTLRFTDNPYEIGGADDEEM